MVTGVAQVALGHSRIGPGVALRVPPSVAVILTLLAIMKGAPSLKPTNMNVMLILGSISGRMVFTAFASASKASLSARVAAIILSWYRFTLRVALNAVFAGSKLVAPPPMSPALTKYASPPR